MYILRRIEPRFFNYSVQNNKEKLLKVERVEVVCNCGRKFKTDLKLVQSGQVGNCGCAKKKYKLEKAPRKNARLYSYLGKKRSLKEISKLIDVPYSTLHKGITKELKAVSGGTNQRNSKNFEITF